MGVEPHAVVGTYNLVQIIPYALVLIGGIVGINVFVVLIGGIISGAVIMLATGQTAATDLLASMGSGASGMFETAMVAVLVAAMCALIRAYGGFDALLSLIRRVFKGNKGGQLGMGLLVGAMDIATANNTVAIVRHHAEKGRLHSGYLLLHLPGCHSLRRTDAGCNFRCFGNGLCHFCL